MSEKNSPVTSSVSPADRAAAAGGWIMFERDGDICPGILEGVSERRARVVRAEGPFKIMRSRIWALWSAAPDSESAADELAQSASASARRTDAYEIWKAAAETMGVEGEGENGNKRSGLHPDALTPLLPAAENLPSHPDAGRFRALALALQNPAYFRRASDGCFVPAPAEEVENARASISARRRRRDEERRMTMELEDGKVPEEISRDAIRLMTAPEKGSAAFRALKKHAGGDGPHIARFFMERGVIADPLAYFSALFEREWRTPRTRELEKEPLQLLEAPDWPKASAEAFSVDDVGTTEVDDAFSATVRGDGRWRLGVHIAAPAARVGRGSALDRIARARAMSVYFPHEKRLMMPPEVVAACSLDAGEFRPALSHYFNFDPESGEMSGGDTVMERICVAGAHTPLEWNEGEVSGEARAVFERLTVAMDSQPEEDIHRPARDFKIRVRDGEPEVVLLRRGPAERVVEAMMRKVNHAWGMMLAVNDNGVFRHRGLTVATPEDPPYAWTSSPLRRYTDLANQRVLLSMLSEDFLPPENWSALARQFDERLIVARRCQRMMERYWALRALQARERGAVLDAEWRDDGRVRLLDFPLSGDIRGAAPGAEGETIKVRVISINLLHLRVRFAPAKRQ